MLTVHDPVGCTIQAPGNAATDPVARVMTALLFLISTYTFSFIDTYFFFSVAF